MFMIIFMLSCVTLLYSYVIPEATASFISTVCVCECKCEYEYGYENEYELEYSYSYSYLSASHKAGSSFISFLFFYTSSK